MFDFLPEIVVNAVIWIVILDLAIDVIVRGYRRILKTKAEYGRRSGASKEA